MRLLCVMMSLAAFPAQADPLPGRRSLSDTPWGYTLVTDPVRAGTQAQRFEVRPGDCAANGGWNDCDRDRERSEFRPDHEWHHGTEVWVGFSIALPADFASSNSVKTTLAQVHQRGGPSREDGERISHPPLMQMELLGDTWRLTVHQANQANIHVPLTTVDALRGRWTDVEIGYDSREGRRVLEVWLNDERRARVEDWATSRPEVYYLKYGVYRSFVSRHDGPMPTQVAWFDEVRIGESRMAVRVDATRPVD